MISWTSICSTGEIAPSSDTTVDEVRSADLVLAWMASHEVDEAVLRAILSRARRLNIHGMTQLICQLGIGTTSEYTALVRQ